MGGSADRLNALLNVHSYYSFGAGTASPTDLVQQAAERGYNYIALTDDLNVTGAAELFQAARAAREEDGRDIKALIGATVPVRVEDQSYPFVLLATSRAGYGTLCRLITLAHEREERDVPYHDLLTHTRGLTLLTGAREGLPTRLLAERRVAELRRRLGQLQEAFPKRLYLQLFHDHYRWDGRRTSAIERLAESLELPTVVAPEVRYLDREDYRLYDALTCARLGISVQESHPRRPQNDCQYLIDPDEAHKRLPYPEAAARATEVAKTAYFELLPKRLVPPKAEVPEGRTAYRHLKKRCNAALPKRYKGSARGPARTRLKEELKTIRELKLANFFLVAAEVTDFCEKEGILAAGRGSAAASVACYLLGITKADPVKHDLLFERFLHTGMAIMPDVDIDISSARRDEVLAWVEERFGPTTEAMVCNKITYRLPLAIQDLGRALGMPPELRSRLTKALGRDFRGLSPTDAVHAEVVFREVLGDAPVVHVLLDLLKRMDRKHARHLAPHCGGVVLARHPLTHYSPLERSSGGIRLLQLDKDDAETLGLIKLDLLGLRMLSALEHCRNEVKQLEGIKLDLADLPDEERVWDLISSGATLGLFQVESPSQQQTSPVMRSRNLTDLAHQIALIRPGPIQSGTVHPYLRRRQKLEDVAYWHSSLEKILAKSQGVLLFQEDVLRIAKHFAGMSWTEADRFRKKVSGWSGFEDLEPHREGFIQGAMQHSDATREQAQIVFDAVQGFQGFGFSESHAWAFALHAYASAWLRLHYPAEYMAAILTEEPGMWSQSTKRQEARDWGVPFLPFDINSSDAQHFHVERVLRSKIDSGSAIQPAANDSTTTAAGGATGVTHARPPTVEDCRVKAVRPPLVAIAGVLRDVAEQIRDERDRHGRYRDIDDAYQRLSLPRETFEALIRAGAFDALQERRTALFRLGAMATSCESGATALFHADPSTPDLATLTLKERYVWDHETTRFSTMEVHAVDFERDQLRALDCVPLPNLRRMPRKTQVRTAGLVVARQRPGTAKGFAFYVIEDGPTRAQVIISPALWDANRVLLRDASMLMVDCTVEDTGHQLTLKALDLAALPAPFTVIGYHFG